MVCVAPEITPRWLVRERVSEADRFRASQADGYRFVDENRWGGEDRVADRGASVEAAVEESVADAGTRDLVRLSAAPDPSDATSAPDSLPAASHPERFFDADALEELEEEITTLAAHIHAATHRLLILIAEFDRRGGWELGGHRSCAHWLSFRTGIDLGAAREKVRTARALAGLPQTSAWMARGELSFSQVRALSRVATEENEGELLELARGCTTAHLERMIRAVRRGSREDEEEAEERRHRSRTLSVFPDEEGMYVVRGRLPAEVGALLMRAVEAASDALYREAGEGWAERLRERRGEEAEEGEGTEGVDGGRRGPGVQAVPAAVLGRDRDTERAAAQRRADALGLLAERALAVGFGSSAMSGSRAERYQVVLHVEAETLEAEGEEPGRSELEDGTRVSGETSRRLSCDAGVVRVHHSPDGSILDVGRRTRTVPPALRRALEARDQGCRFPGCGLRFTDAHHVRHWGEGGETKLENLVLLCRHHHRLVHEGGWRVGWWGPGRAVFFDPRGGTHYDGRWRLRREGRGKGEEEGVGGERRAAPEGERSVESGDRREAWAHSGPGTGKAVDKGEHRVEALLRDNRRRGVEPDGWTAGARWRREVDIPDEVYFQALEALEESGR